ncbi:MAG: hypothetical protein A2V63_02860 [Candidatus Eisenbacteria bacterium RBG_19FT_COMBO_70_11]|nr:MAG: hypothetical protein A2V63_02860 [Candidatus Eisenbacteria bacterium RBG_19FT_COMBO_70_11]
MEDRAHKNRRGCAAVRRARTARARDRAARGSFAFASRRAGTRRPACARRFATVSRLPVLRVALMASIV